MMSMDKDNAAVVAGELNRQEDADWSQCPVCDSFNIEGDWVEISGGEASQDVECLSCNATWTEVYKQSDRVFITKG